MRGFAYTDLENSSQGETGGGESHLSGVEGRDRDVLRFPERFRLVGIHYVAFIGILTVQVGSKGGGERV